jgi:hypothetical protein
LLFNHIEKRIGFLVGGGVAATESLAQQVEVWRWNSRCRPNLSIGAKDCFDWLQKESPVFDTNHFLFNHLLNDRIEILHSVEFPVAHCVKQSFYRRFHLFRCIPAFADLI